MNRIKVLIVEDDLLLQKIVAKNIKSGHIEFASDKYEAFKKLKNSDYDICFADLMLGENDEYSGLEIVKEAKKKNIYTVVMTSSGNKDTINKAYSYGADDYYLKGNESKVIDTVFRKFFNSNKINLDKDKIFCGQFITKDLDLQMEILNILKFSYDNIATLILGPTGSGKTALARLIHDYSLRKGSFIDINCSAYNEELLEAELFGYKKGAFTGADEDRSGKLKQADGGTLFLDEIGAMSLLMQQKLLKAIEEKSFYPVGSNRKEYSDFKIISATLEEPDKLLKEKKMRQDFYNRINGLKIYLKPLNRRNLDIFPLIEHFTKDKKQLAFSNDAADFILRYQWPGNIRQLKNFVDYFASYSKGVIDRHDIEKYLEKGANSAESALNTDLNGKSLDDYLDEIAYQIIRKELENSAGKVTSVLKKLKISTRRFYSILNKFEGENGKRRD